MKNREEKNLVETYETSSDAEDPEELLLNFLIAHPSQINALEQKEFQWFLLAAKIEPTNEQEVKEAVADRGDLVL